MEAPKDQDSIITRFREGPNLLDRTLAGVSEADLDTPPSQGGWTIRQIVHHLADGDDLWKTFIKAALGNGKHAFGHSQSAECSVGAHRDVEGPWIGVADVLTRKDQHPPKDE